MLKRRIFKGNDEDRKTEEVGLGDWVKGNGKMIRYADASDRPGHQATILTYTALYYVLTVEIINSHNSSPITCSRPSNSLELKKIASQNPLEPFGYNVSNNKTHNSMTLLYRKC